MTKIVSYQEIDGQLTELTSDATPVDLAMVIAEYQQLKSIYQTMPAFKDTPDQETLQFYNTDILLQREAVIGSLKAPATALYIKVKAIRDAGLLPAEYEDEYLQLETFVNGL